MGRARLMRPNGGVDAEKSSGFVHQALIYESEREFLDHALPFVEDGISAGEPVLVAVQAANVEAMRAAIGPEAGARLLSAAEGDEDAAPARHKVARWGPGEPRGGRGAAGSG